MKTKSLSISLCLLALLFAPPVSSADSRPEGEVKIGVIAALSGPVSWWGQSIARTAAYADKDRDTKDHITLVYEDDQFSAKNAVNAATKLIDQDHVAALITFSGGPSTAVAELCERKKVPMIGISTVDTYTKGKEHVYRIFMSNSAQMKLFTSEFDKRNLKQIGIATVAQESMLAARNVLLEMNPGRFVVNEEVLPDQTDMNSIATKLRAKNPEAMVLFINPPLLSKVTRALRGQGYTGPFFGGVGTFSPAEIEASQGALLGTVFPSPPRLKAKALLDRYEAEFHDIPSGDSIFAYDAISLLISGIESGDVAKYLQEGKAFDGILGTYSRDGHSYNSEASLWTVESSKAMRRLYDNGK